MPQESTPPRTRPERAPIAGEPVLPDVEMHLHTIADPFEATVVATHRCTASPKAAGFIRHVSLDISGSRMAGKFLPGQSFGVIPPGADEKGLSHKLRLYSIASPSSGEDGRGHIIATTVKRLIDEHLVTHKLFLGIASNFLCDLTPGDKVRVTGPSGKRFLLPADTSKHDYVFFATGTGIAPFRGMILDLARRHAASNDVRVVLVMGSPYASDLIYHRELLDLASRFPGFTYLPTLSRQPQDDGTRPMYVQDRLALARDRLLPILESPRGLLYVCGIAGMEIGIFQALARELSPDARAQYLAVDPDLANTPDAWDRKMLNRQIRPTRRTFLEVY